VNLSESSCLLDLLLFVTKMAQLFFSLTVGGKGVTPAMAMGFCARPLTMLELLTSQGFSSMSP
jgi:hypothetical protein